MPEAWASAPAQTCQLKLPALPVKVLRTLSHLVSNLMGARTTRDSLSIVFWEALGVSVAYRQLWIPPLQRVRPPSLTKMRSKHTCTHVYTQLQDQGRWTHWVNTAGLTLTRSDPHQAYPGDCVTQNHSTGPVSQPVQAAITKYHRWDSLNYRHLFLTVLESEKSKIKVLQIWFLVRALLLPCRQPRPYCVVTWQKVGERQWGSAFWCLFLLSAVFP